MKIQPVHMVLIAVMTTVVSGQPPKSSSLGIFDNHNDIGQVQHKGWASYDAQDDTYTVSGSGTDIGSRTDEFHFIWKKTSGNISLSALIEMMGEDTDPHRKASLMIRQNLEPDAPYVNVTLQGNGLTAMQFRETKGGLSREIRCKDRAPDKIQIRKVGDYYTMYTGYSQNKMEIAGGSLRLPLKSPFYIGLGVCSHNREVLETMKFKNVVFERNLAPINTVTKVESSLEILDIVSLDRSEVYHTQSHIEAPNWTPDGKYLIYNSEGLLYKMNIANGVQEQIPTGFAHRINNDHGLSPDGTQIVISDETETGNSMIYSLPIEGGDPKKITSKAPSYWHGWSPDGKTLAYCAERRGNYDIYTIPFEGGKEIRLTSAKGLDDGPDYSPDGQYIYFNSTRTGTMQIWRMKPDGTDQEQVTTDAYNDWFAHPSPDGKWIAYVTFGTDVPAGAHPPNKDVMLRLMDLKTKEVTVLAKLFGGQGTINVPSWSPDSKKLAFVSYHPVK